jgi:hypothetical protein
MPDEDLSFDDFDLNIESVPSSREPKPQNPLDKSRKTPVTELEQQNFAISIQKDIEKNWERLSAIINNLKSSRIFEVTEDTSENHNLIGNVERDFEDEILRGIKLLESRYKELTSQYKPIGSYIANYPRSRKEKLLTYSTEKEKMFCIFAWEMQDEFLSFLNKFSKMLTELMTLMNQRGTSSALKAIHYHGQRMFEDAKTSCLFTMGEIDVLRKDITKWQIETN